MPTRTATANSYHGATTANTAEVVVLPVSTDTRESTIRVVRWSGSGDLWFDLNPAGDDIDITTAGQSGLHRIADGVTASKEIPVLVDDAVNVVLKSTGAVIYTVERA